MRCLESAAATLISLTIVGAFAGAERCDYWSFSNERVSGEHAYGESITLWKTEGAWEGGFTRQCGLMGDVYSARLRDVNVDERTGEVTFNVNAPMGYEHDRT